MSLFGLLGAICVIVGVYFLLVGHAIVFPIVVILVGLFLAGGTTGRLRL